MRLQADWDLHQAPRREGQTSLYCDTVASASQVKPLSQADETYRQTPGEILYARSQGLILVFQRNDRPRRGPAA